MPFVIHDTTGNDLLFPTSFGRGYEERDYARYPAEMLAAPTQIQKIDRSEWSARIKERKQLGVGLRFVRERMNDGRPHVSLDQNGQGYCWSYSGAHAVMYSRAAAGMPYRRLSAHAVACVIKGFRDEGGWCGLSAEKYAKDGCPTVQDWPEKSMSRSYNTAAVWEVAKLNRVADQVVDLTRAVYDRNLSFDLVVSLLLVNVPVQIDLNWWSHSVCAIDVDEVEPGSFGIVIQNSWTDAWGDRGLGTLQGNRAIPDGAVATTSVVAA
ncbi:hypothetical protein J0H58_27710 [bacterium]|nr:hypothetical protein [bacterium]